MLAAADDLDRRAADGERLTGLADGVGDLALAQLLGGAGVDHQLRARVLGQERRQFLQVEVVEVLVGDQDGVETLEGLVARGEGARIEQDPGRAGVRHDAGVAEVHEFHAIAVPRRGAPVTWSAWLA